MIPIFIIVLATIVVIAEAVEFINLTFTFPVLDTYADIDKPFGIGIERLAITKSPTIAPASTISGVSVAALAAQEVTFETELRTVYETLFKTLVARSAGTKDRGAGRPADGPVAGQATTKFGEVDAVT